MTAYYIPFARFYIRAYDSAETYLIVLGLAAADIFFAGVSMAFSADGLVLLGEKVISRRLSRVLSSTSAGASVGSALVGLAGLTLAIYVGPNRILGLKLLDLFLMATILFETITADVCTPVMCWTLDRARKLAMAVYRQRLSYNQAQAGAVQR